MIDDSFRAAAITPPENSELRAAHLEVPHLWPLPVRAQPQRSMPNLRISGPGHLYVHLNIDLRSKSELKKIRKQAVANCGRQKGWLRTQRAVLHNIIFTNRIYVDGGYSFQDIPMDRGR